MIPGTLPKLTCVEEIGRCAGELSSVMQKLDVKLVRAASHPCFGQRYDMMALQLWSLLPFRP